MERDRIAELDILRFTAAVSVVLFHASHWPAQPSLLTQIFTYGFMGVPLFFIISGFVILMTVQQRGALEFVNSRIARLYPTFWIGLALSCAALAAFGDGLPPLAVIAANATMQPRLLFGQPYIDPVYWTLVVEMKFYALVLLLLLTNQMKRVELFLTLWLGVVVAATLVSVPHWVEAVAFPRWASLFIGGCILYLIRSRGATTRRFVTFAVSVLLSIYWSLQYQSKYTHSIDPGTQVTVVALLLLIHGALLLVALRKWRLRHSRLWLWLGCLTYPLYLTHAKAGHLVWTALHGDPWPRMWITLALVLLVSGVLAAVIERRACSAFNRLLNRTTQHAIARLASMRAEQAAT